MRNTPLGRDGPVVSEFCLGTMTWGTQTSEAEAHAQIDRALDAGVNFIDTAEMYPVNPVARESLGRTEEIIGAWNRRSGRRGELVLASKVTGLGRLVRPDQPVTGRTLTEALEGSLRRLGTDHVDLYQLHWPNRGSYHFRQNWKFDPSQQVRAATLAHMEDVLRAVERLVQQGKIGRFGLSNESAWGTAMWLRIAEENGLPRVVSIQNEYSLLCRLYDTDLAELGVNEAVTLLAFSPLATGLLSGKYAGDATPAGSRRSHNPTLGRRITPRVGAAVSAYLDIAARFGLDPCQMALAWFRTRPFPVIPIIGARTLAQLESELGAVELSLDAAVLGEIEAAHKAHPLPY